MKLLVIILTCTVCYAALPPRHHQTPGEAAEQLFHDADADGDGNLHLAEMVQLFDRYDANGDQRVGINEYVNYMRAHEPDLVPMARDLFNVLDHDGDHFLELTDFMELYLQMNPDVTDDVVSAYTFIGYFTVLYTNLMSI